MTIVCLLPSGIYFLFLFLQCFLLPRSTETNRPTSVLMWWQESSKREGEREGERETWVEGTMGRESSGGWLPTMAESAAEGERQLCDAVRRRDDDGDNVAFSVSQHCYHFRSVHTRMHTHIHTKIHILPLTINFQLKPPCILPGGRQTVLRARDSFFPLLHTIRHCCALFVSATITSLLPSCYKVSAMPQLQQCESAV